MRKHPRARRWTLADLDRSGTYRLWFDQETQRWELDDLGEGGGRVVTRDPYAQRKARRVATQAACGEEATARPARGGAG